jgi:hypothetical protein
MLWTKVWPDLNLLDQEHVCTPSLSVQQLPNSAGPSQILVIQVSETSSSSCTLRSVQAQGRGAYTAAGPVSLRHRNTCVARNSSHQTRSATGSSPGTVLLQNGLASLVSAGHKKELFQSHSSGLHMSSGFLNVSRHTLRGEEGPVEKAAACWFLSLTEEVGLGRYFYLRLSNTRYAHSGLLRQKS